MVFVEAFHSGRLHDVIAPKALGESLHFHTTVVLALRNSLRGSLKHYSLDIVLSCQRGISISVLLKLHPREILIHIPMLCPWEVLVHSHEVRSALGFLQDQSWLEMVLRITMIHIAITSVFSVCGRCNKHGTVCQKTGTPLM